MEHLKRTKGIDPKAHDSVLHGHVSLVLKDAVTGKVKEKIDKDNFFTVGLDSAINGCPWGLDHIDFSYGATPVSSSLFRTTPVINQLLGGITIYPNSLGNDTNLLFPDFTNIPTGYASLDSYTQDDSKQGIYDGVNSGAITNGWKHVYNWGSAFGNGQVAALALNPRGAHTWCKDLSVALPSNAIGGGYQGFMCDTGSSGIIAASEHGIFYRTLETSPSTYAFADIKPFATNLLQAYVGTQPTINTLSGITPKWTLPLSSYTANWQFIGNKLVNISVSGSNVTVTKFNLDDGTVASTDTYSFAASFGTGHCCINNGYFYCCKSSGGSIYKCNLSNEADVDEITDTSIVANDYCFDVGSNFVYGFNFILDGDNEVIQPFTTGFGISTANNSFIVYETGMWICTASDFRSLSSNPHGLGVQIKKWGCMTHANLDSVVQKTADKQMTVEYSIVQQ